MKLAAAIIGYYCNLSAIYPQFIPYRLAVLWMKTMKMFALNQSVEDAGIDDHSTHLEAEFIITDAFTTD